MSAPVDDQRTFAAEDQLPRVPLPSIEDSCERFLNWCAPLLSPSELDSTRSAVDAFLRPDSGARVLQAALEAYEATAEVPSWLDTFWPYRYLGRRDRIALNANFFFLFEDPPQPQGQLERAARLVAASVAYKLRLDEELVPPLVQQGRALSMHQLKSLFSATRIPGPVLDSVRTPYTDEWPGPSRERHVVVLSRGHLVRMDVIDPLGRPHTVAELEAGLRDVLATTAAPAPADESVGHLTSKARAEWADSRRRLLECTPENAAALDAVETALFCVCLDGAPADVQQACDALLHGDSANRWFDKAVSWVVFADGTAGVNIEHCNLDGTTVLNLVDTVLVEAAELPHAGERKTPTVAPIEFGLDTDLRADIRSAGEAFTAYASDTTTSAVSFPGFGVQQIKQLRMSPDAFVQMAYQLAHQRSRGLVGATYESIATRHFHHGRTEAMRVVTPEVISFVAAMTDVHADEDTRRAALRAAAEAHVARAQQCRAGNAPEQHLWELQLIQRRRGAELGVLEPLSLYASPGWVTMRDDYLSTSSAPSAHVRFFGFGSTTARCIGVAYVLRADRLNVYLSASRQLSTEVAAFAAELRTAIEELRGLLAGEAPAG